MIVQTLTFLESIYESELKRKCFGYIMISVTSVHVNLLESHLWLN